jgi:imidazolonepropionase-like amidohydrolase
MITRSALIIASLLLTHCGTTGLTRKKASRVYNPIKILKAREVRANRAIEKIRVTAGPLVILENATIMTATGQNEFIGYIVLDKGRIKALAKGAAGPLPGAKRYDLKGKFITPGIIDTHSHLGVYPAPHAKAHSDGNEMTGPTTPGVWAEHGFWPQDPNLEFAVAGGVTTIQALPGSANLIGGRGVTLHMVRRRGSRAMRFPGAPTTLKMACGENPKRVYGKKGRAPGTRMGNVRGHRKAFIKAQNYVQKLKRLGPRTPRDPGLETLAGVLLGTVLSQVHCYRADDILAFLQVADEFDFKIRAFHHGLEAYKVRDILAKKNISVSTWADWWGYKLEMFDGIPENAALLHDAGGKPVIHSDSSLGIQRLNQEAAKAFYAGQRAGIKVTRQDALRWITINAAWTLGIDHEVGTLEPGKRADIVVWSRDPFSVYAKAEWVFVDGFVRYARAKKGKPESDFMLGQEVAK